MSGELGIREAGARQVVSPLHEALRGVGIGADVIQRDHFHAPAGAGDGLERRAGLLARGLRQMRTVTFLAALLKQQLAARRLLAIDGAEDVLRPARRAQQLQGVFDTGQGRDIHRAAEPLLRRQRLAAVATSGVMAPTPSA